MEIYNLYLSIEDEIRGVRQFGDFFSDMAINIGLNPVTAAGGVVPAFPPMIGNTMVSSTATGQVSGTPNPATGLYTQYTQQYVDIQGNILSVGATSNPFVRYCEYPGERLFTQVAFEVNGNPLDNYGPEAAFFYRKFKLAPNKVVGWNRLMGQEVPVDAYTDLISVAGTSNWPTNIDGIVDTTGNAAYGAPVNAVVTARKIVQVVYGPQTPQATQPLLDLWIPLLFWFNKDPRLSIASVSIPYGQRFITVGLEQQSNIVFLAPGNLFYRLTVETQLSASTGQGTVAAQGVTDVKRWVTLTPTLASGASIVLANGSTQAIANMDLYINNIFVNPEIHDIYIRRIGFSLIRVYRTQINQEAVPSDSVLLSQLKWPIEYMFVGLRPAINVSPANPNQYRDWHRMSLPVDNHVQSIANAAVDIMTLDTVPFNTASISHKTSESSEVVENLTFPTFVQTVDTIQLQAHGINIYDIYKSAFYRDYLPFTYGGDRLNTPYDAGAYIINFCLYPGTYQPSGHINVSRAREFYLNFTSSYVSSTTMASLIVLASAINFLLISDGSAVLRYST